MRRDALILALVLVLVLVPIAVHADGWDYPAWSVALDGVTSYINAGSDTTLDDLPIGPDGFTIEGWFRPDNSGEGLGGFLLSKGPWSPSGGYVVMYSNGQGKLYFSGAGATSDWSASFGEWSHFALTYKDTGDRKARLWINGELSSITTSLSGPYLSDAAFNQTIGALYTTSNSFFGGVGWIRISSTVRYTSSFAPPPRHQPPANDAYTVRLFRMDDGYGITIADYSDNATDATLSGGAWEYWSGPTTFGLGLGAWWDLEEESGTRYDAAGYSDLTDNNSVSQVTGRVDYAAGFEAGNFEYLSAPDNAAISSIYSVTVASWVYLDSIAADQEIVSKGDGANAEYQLYYDSGSNQFRFGVGDGASFTTVAATTPSPALTQTWYLVVGNHDPAADQLLIQVYNGDTPLAYYPSSSAYGSGGYNGSNPLYIGRAGATYYSGRADSVGYWGGDAINSDERAWLFNGGDGRAYTAFPPPTPTPVPTPTPDPNAYYVDLPSGKRAVWYASITAGEATIIVLMLLGLFLLVYIFLRDTVMKWLQR